MGRKIRHGNLHYLLELPRNYRDAVRRYARKAVYDVIELNQPHAYLAAIDNQRCARPAIFINRSHGHEVRADEAVDHWRRTLQCPPQRFLHRSASRGIRWLLTRHWTKIARFADGFVVSSTEDRDFLRNRYRVAEERIGVITQGVPNSFLTMPARAFDSGRLTKALYVGQYAFIKAPIILAQTLAMVLSACPAVTMTWVCSRAHHAKVRGLLPENLLSRVRLCDWIAQEKLIQVYDEHGLFLFPSFFEGFGKTPLEAMARGLCVISSDTGGMRDYIKSGENGLLVPVGRPDVMAERAAGLLGNLTRCQAMSSAARETACQHTWDRCARDATEFYRHLIERKSHGWG